MQEKHLYEYSVIRFVPKVEREEFINVGVIVFCKRNKFLKSMYAIDENKIKLFSSEVSMECLSDALRVYGEVCNGNNQAGPIAKMELPDRFRWLTAVKSSCIQTSRPHPGFTNDLDETLDRLFRELVQ